MSETSKFTEDILGAAKEKAQVIISEAEVESQKALEEAKAHSAREAEDVLSSARAEAESIKRRHISEARHKLKIREQEEKDKILDEVLERARKRVTALVGDEAKYLPYLTGLIVDGANEIGLDTVAVHLNSNDLKRVKKTIVENGVQKKLKKSLKIEWTKEPVDAVGGAIISSVDGKTRIVNTIDQRLDALEPKLLMEAGKILFSE